MNTIDILSKKRNSCKSENISHSTKKMNSLLEIIENFFTKQNFEINFQLIYSKCHEVCQSRLAGELFNKIEELILKILDDNFENLMKIENTQEFLLKFKENFYSFKTKSLVISDALLYLDNLNQRFHITDLKIYETFMLKFFDRIISSNEMKNKMLDIFFSFLLKFRKSECDIDEQFLNLFQNGILEIFVKFKKFNAVMLNFERYKNHKIAFELFFKEFFEKLNLETEIFYYIIFVKKFKSKCSSENCQAYIEYILDSITREEILWKSLDEEKKKILEIILDKLLLDKIDFIFQKGVRKFLKHNNFKMMQTVYKLFFYLDSNENNKNKFYENFQETILNFLKETDTNLIKKNNFNKVEYINFYQYVDELFEKKKKFSEFLTNSFDNFSKIEHITKLSFEKIINKHEDFLQNFIELIHEEIKISIKTRTNKVKDFNDKFLTIFKSINDKDYFEIEYRKYLAKRLMRNTSMMKETEYDFYFSMKKHSGGNFVKKIENMFNDIYISQDLNLEFRKKICANKANSLPSELDFFVKILSHDNWPIEGITIKTNRRGSLTLIDIHKNDKNSFALPKVIELYIDNFTVYYYEKFKNRQLSWAHSLSWGEVQGRFKNKTETRTYTCILSGLQTAILYLYNVKSIYSYEEIILSLMISTDNIKHFEENIAPLINCGLLRVSNINSKSSQLSLHSQSSANLTLKDMLEINSDFSSDKNKIILNISNKLEKTQSTIEDKEISHFVLEDRKHQIDSVLIKILKKYRVISFEELKLNIFNSVKNFFIPEVNLIKTRLENLMERNFIKRDEEDVEKYLYIL